MNNNVKLVPEIIEKIKVLPLNTETTISELIGYNPEECFVDPLIQGQIFSEVIAMCRKENICIESNRDEIGGLAFYRKFRKIDLNESESVNMNNEFKINNNIVFKDEETKVEYQKYLDEINEYNRKVANGEKPESDLSEIMSKFKEKFNVECAENNHIEDKKFDELMGKLNQSLDSNYTNTDLPIDEQIENIDKRIEELNKLEDNDI